MAQTPRDRHIWLIARQGRMAWQKITGYGRRNLVETAMGRYKHLIGPKLHARTLAGQQSEAALAVGVLNRRIRTAKPVSGEQGIPNPAPWPCNNALPTG